jgi:hypothetical protein
MDWKDTGANKQKLKKICLAFAVIQSVLLVLAQERLDVRRLDLSWKFASKFTKFPRHSSMFHLNPNYRPNMRHPKPYMKHLCHTSRYFHSPIPFLARLLKKHSKKTNDKTQNRN